MRLRNIFKLQVAGKMAEGDQPQRKKPKLSQDDPIFKEFHEDSQRLEKLRIAIYDIKYAISQESQVVFRKIIEANAREACSFSKASVTLENYKDKPGLVSPGLFFTTAVKILVGYCAEEPRIPADPDLQIALSKLLKYLSSDNGNLMFKESKKVIKERLLEYHWAVVVAQHLLSQLAVQNDYVIVPYPNLRIDSNKCVCQKQDGFVGKFGDTSFGCVEKPGGWNGEVDVILEGSSVSVEVQAEEGDKDIEKSVSSVEVKTENVDHSQSERQTTAQAIVFSFLQRKHNKACMKNFLVPSITVGTSSYRLAFYDSENDVLVSTLPETKLFDNYSEDLLCTVIVLFWMTLNYRLLCSGVPQHSKLFEINDVKAGFFERVGDHLYVYQEKVTRPAPRASCADKTPVPYGRGKPMDQELLDDCHIDFIGLK